SDNVVDGNAHPRYPGEQAAEVQTRDVRDGLRTPDRREISLVAVVERGWLPTSETIADRPRRVAPLLHRHGRETRQPGRSPLGVVHLDHVPESDHLGVAGEGQIRADGDSPGAGDAGARLSR